METTKRKCDACNAETNTLVDHSGWKLCRKCSSSECRDSALKLAKQGHANKLKTSLAMK